jgi:hypothetical protein
MADYAPLIRPTRLRYGDERPPAPQRSLFRHLAYHRRKTLRCCALRTALFHNRHKCYVADMTTAEDIEKAVEQLAPRELARFRAWFEAFDAAQFDAAIERDINAGKLDAHAEEALAAHRAGRSRDL